MTHINRFCTALLAVAATCMTTINAAVTQMISGFSVLTNRRLATVKVNARILVIAFALLVLPGIGIVQTVNVAQAQNHLVEPGGENLWNRSNWDNLGISNNALDGLRDDFINFYSPTQRDYKPFDNPRFNIGAYPPLAKAGILTQSDLLRHYNAQAIKSLKSLLEKLEAQQIGQRDQKIEGLEKQIDKIENILMTGIFALVSALAGIIFWLVKTTSRQNKTPVLLCAAMLFATLPTNSVHACHPDGNCAELYQAVHGINWITATADQVRQWHKNGGDLNKTGEGVIFPLHEAISQYNTAAAKTLIELGADVNAKNKHGDTSLDVAKKYENSEVIAILQNSDGVAAQPVYPSHLPDCKANPSCLNFSHLREVSFFGGLSFAKETAKWQSFTAADMQAMIDAGANVNYYSSATPLYYAVIHENLEVIPVLLRAGANVNAKADNGDTPLDVAKKYENSEAIAILRDPAAAIAKLEKQHADEAERKSQAEVTTAPQVEIPAAPAVPKVDNGHTLLHRAAFDGKVAVIRVILEDGADINELSDTGKTAFDYAFANRHKEAMKILFNAGGRAAKDL